MIPEPGSSYSPDDEISEVLESAIPMTKRRFLVTSALPYSNGRLHVGHVAGAYLPADTFVRYLKARGEEVCFICGLSLIHI